MEEWGYCHPFTVRSASTSGYVGWTPGNEIASRGLVEYGDLHRFLIYKGRRFITLLRADRLPQPVREDENECLYCTEHSCASFGGDRQRLEESLGVAITSRVCKERAAGPSMKDHVAIGLFLDCIFG